VVIALVAAGAAVKLAYPGFRRERDVRAEEAFQAERLSLVRDRARLVEEAALLYDRRFLIPGTPCLRSSNWMLSSPVALEEVRVDFTATRRRDAMVTGKTRQAQALLPRSIVKKGIDTYSKAIGHYLTLRPALFWNGLSYDLREFKVEVDGGVRLQLGLASFFEMVDVCESLAHEFSVSQSAGRKSIRRLIGDPFDFEKHVNVPALTWLLLIREPDSRLTFTLHARDEKAVASDGAFKHVFGGQVQPSSQHTVDATPEATLWHSFMREFAEEILGLKEADGNSGAPVDYDQAPFSTLRQLRDEGALKVALLGLALDPLSHWPSLLAVAVGDRRRLEAELPSFVERNEEGVVVSRARQLHGFELSESMVQRLCADQQVGAAAKGCLHLAWLHRAELQAAT
jgi:hypothetical protein